MSTGLTRAAWRRVLKQLGAKSGDRTYNGLVPPDCRFEPERGRIDPYTDRTDIRKEDLVILAGGRGEDGMVPVTVSHLGAGISAKAAAADDEQAFHLAMKVLRGRVVIIRMERERDRQKERSAARQTGAADQRVGETRERS